MYAQSIQSCLTATLWTVARQAPLSMGLSQQEYLSGLPFPTTGDLPDPRIEPASPALQVDSLPAELPGNSYMSHLVLNLKPFLNIGHDYFFYF